MLALGIVKFESRNDCLVATEISLQKSFSIIGTTNSFEFELIYGLNTEKGSHTNNVKL